MIHIYTQSHTKTPPTVKEQKRAIQSIPVEERNRHRVCNQRLQPAMPNPLIRSLYGTGRLQPSHGYCGVLWSRGIIEHPLHYIQTHNRYLIHVHRPPDSQSFCWQHQTNDYGVRNVAQRHLHHATIELDGSPQCAPPRASGNALFAAILNDTSNSDYYPRRIRSAGMRRVAT